MEVFIKLNPDGSIPVAADGWYSTWGSWQPCSKSCAGGTRERSKTYTPPVNGGLELLLSGGASSLDTEACNTQNCPIDGTWKEWSSWCCSTCCGAGLSSRSRACNPPLYGGKDCEGADEETGEPCNELKTCGSGTVDTARIDGNKLDVVEVVGTSLDTQIHRYRHNLTSCAQVLFQVQYQQPIIRITSSTLSITCIFNDQACTDHPKCRHFTFTDGGCWGYLLSLKL